MTGAIVDLSRQAAPATVTTEICVVGSGSAGATAAWDLARAGHEVVVLEEGGDFTGARLTQRDGRMYDQLYMERGGRATADLSVTVLQGRVLGGGGVVNACDVVPIHDGVLRHWQRRWGLTDFGPEALAPFQARAMQDVSASRPSAEDPVLFNRNNRLLRRGAEALGWKGEVMLHDRVGCAGIGTCLIGCPIDAKRSPRAVAVPGAVAAGARFLLRARAVRIDGAGEELKTVQARRLDPDGHREQDGFAVRARVVILAANAVSSAELLLRSGIGNQQVGRHLSLQPQLPVAAFFDDEVRSFRGIPQSYAVTQFEELDHPDHGWWGFRVEAIAGTPGIVATLLPRLGRAGEDDMRRYGHMAAALCLMPDEAQGRVEVERSGRLRIHYQLTDEQRHRARAAARAAARMYLAAGAREVIVPVVPPVAVRSQAELGRIDGMELRPATAPFLSAHQQGGVRLAPSPRDGAADPEGRVHGARDVLVLDSGGYPSSASSHTMVPIISTARYLAARLEARLRR
jgi:choline dehydrogenase-like flavoprotein